MARSRIGAILTTTVLLTGAGCGGQPAESDQPRSADAVTGGAWVRGDEPWRGILRGGVDEPSAVSIDGLPELPAAAAAYRVVSPTITDLEEIAELHAGGRVTPGTFPGASPDLAGFDAGDGWFAAAPNYLADDYTDLTGDSWSWTQRAWREALPPDAYLEPLPCATGTPVPARVAPFFAELGIDIEPTGRMECAGGLTNIRFDVLLGGLRVVDSSGVALVNGSGEVVSASAPFMTFEPLGDLELAPVPEVLRRLLEGPGTVGPAGSCTEPCRYSTRGAVLALGLVRTGGIGSHDHLPGNMVAGSVEQLVVPVLRVPVAGPADPSKGDASLSSIALSSALLVDDPSQAGAARTADANVVVPGPADPTGGCSGVGNALMVCASSVGPAVGEPVVLTVGGEMYGPVGARDCAPVLTLDPGDGSSLTAPAPGAGTLVTSAIVHVYEQPGTYAVTAHRASQCGQPAEGGGSEPEYDEMVRVTVTVAQ